MEEADAHALGVASPRSDDADAEQHFAAAEGEQHAAPDMAGTNSGPPPDGGAMPQDKLATVAEIVATAVKNSAGRFVCPIVGCGNDFSYRNNLRRHVVSHVGIKQHACTICDRCFARSDDLTAHARVHSGERPYGCIVLDCGKRYARISDLRCHERLHDSAMGPSSAQLGCSYPECVAEFGNMSGLREHCTGEHDAIPGVWSHGGGPADSSSSQPSRSSTAASGRGGRPGGASKTSRKRAKVAEQPAPLVDCSDGLGGSGGPSLEGYSHSHPAYGGAGELQERQQYSLSASSMAAHHHPWAHGPQHSHSLADDDMLPPSPPRAYYSSTGAAAADGGHWGPGPGDGVGEGFSAYGSAASMAAPAGGGGDGGGSGDQFSFPAAGHNSTSSSNAGYGDSHAYVEGVSEAGSGYAPEVVDALTSLIRLDPTSSASQEYEGSAPTYFSSVSGAATRGDHPSRSRTAEAHSSENPFFSGDVAEGPFAEAPVVPLANHTHAPGCGHPPLQYGCVVVYLMSDGYLEVSGNPRKFLIPAMDVFPVGCTSSHPAANASHDGDSVYGSSAAPPQGPAVCEHVHQFGCGHMYVWHHDHVDYLCNNRLHFPHGDHCDDHGEMVFVDVQQHYALCGWEALQSEAVCEAAAASPLP